MKTDKLKKLNACSEAIQWAEQQDNEQQAWVIAIEVIGCCGYAESYRVNLNLKEGNY
jgi:hypothetical protein